MSGVAELEKEVLRLRAEVRELKREKNEKLPTCAGCDRLRRHDCGAFWVCPYFGVVDVEQDGCRRRIVHNG